MADTLRSCPDFVDCPHNGPNLCNVVCSRTWADAPLPGTFPNNQWPSNIRATGSASASIHELLEENEIPSAELGHCGLCGQAMLRTYEPTLDVWHPHDVKFSCPPEPRFSISDDPEAWQKFYDAGYRSGRPGTDYFLPNRKKD